MISPYEILRRTAETYGSCSSYRDVGEVVTRTTMSRGVSTESKPFSTHFITPHRFRFEFYTRTSEPDEKPDRLVIWSDRRVVGSRWSVRPEIDLGAKLGERLEAAAGISDGASHALPSLLLPFEFKVRLLEGFTVDACSLDEAERPCYKLVGTCSYWDLQPKSYWIDAESFLIRRIHEANEFTREVLDRIARESQMSRQRFIAAHPERAREIPPTPQLQAVEPFSTDCTTSYTPELDPSIPPEVFTDPLGPHGP